MIALGWCAQDGVTRMSDGVSCSFVAHYPNATFLCGKTAADIITDIITVA